MEISEEILDVQLREFKKELSTGKALMELHEEGLIPSHTSYAFCELYLSWEDERYSEALDALPSDSPVGHKILEFVRTMDAVIGRFAADEDPKRMAEAMKRNVEVWMFG